MKLSALTAVAVTALLTATSAMAHTMGHRSFSKMTLSQIKNYQLRVIKHDEQVINTWKRRTQNISPQNDAIDHQVWWHLQQLRWTTRELHKTEKTLKRASFGVSGPLPAHFRGWWCIHAGAYPGAPHEGSGYNGQYSGPLQMSNGWMGYHVSDWNKLPMATVFADAETVAAAHGFSYAFMQGQWPQTFPPCAGYFR